MADAIFSVRLSEDIDARLDLLSKSTNRSKALLAAEAIAQFVQSEDEIAEDVRTGMADVQAGRTVPHREAMRQIRETLARIADEAKSA